MALGNRYRMAVEGTCRDQEIVTTFWYYQNGLLPGSRNDGAQYILDQWQRLDVARPILNAFLAFMPSEYRLNRIHVFNIDNNFDAASILPNRTGALGGTELCPLSAAIVGSVRTGGSGRSFRGRNYFGPVLETYQNGGIISDALFNLVTNFYLALRTEFLVSGPMQYVVYSKKLDTQFAVTNVLVRRSTGVIRGRRAQPGA